MPPFKKAILISACLVCSSLLGLFMVTYHTNPYGFFNKSLYIGNDSEQQARIELGSYAYLQKAKHLVLNQPRTIILGSSVADLAIRCTGSSLLLSGFPKSEEGSAFSSKDLYNASIAGGDLEDAWAYLQHAYVNNPQLKRVVLGLDLHILVSKNPFDIKSKALDILGKRSIPLDVYLKYTIGSASVQNAVWILQAKYLNKQDKKNLTNIFHPLSFIAETFSHFLNFFRSSVSLSNFITHAHSAAQKETGVVPGLKPTFEAYQDSSLAFIENELLIRKLIFASWFGFFSSPPVGIEPSLTAFKILRQIVSFCKEKNIELVIYLSPSHPVWFQVIKKEGGLRAVYNVMRAIARVTPFYDFSSKVTFSKDVDSYFGGETLHYNGGAGDIILASLLGSSSASDTSEKKLIDSTNVEELIKFYRESQTQWALAHPRIVKLLTEGKWKVEGLPADLLQLAPKVYKPTYRNYRLFSFLQTYWAVPLTAKLPVELSKLILMDYPGMLRASALEDLLKQIEKHA